MYLNCITQEAANRQREFEMLLLEKMAVQPYSKITVGQLCREVGVSRNAFYRYFDSKDDVLHALIDHKLLEYYQDQAYCPDSIESYRQEIVSFLQYWKDQKPLLDALNKNNLRSKLIERCMNHNLQRHLEQFAYPILGSDERRYQATLFATVGIFTLILDWHLNGCKQSISEMAETMEHVMLTPLISLDRHQ